MTGVAADGGRGREDAAVMVQVVAEASGEEAGQGRVVVGLVGLVVGEMGAVAAWATVVAGVGVEEGAGGAGEGRGAGVEREKGVAMEGCRCRR